MTLVAPEIRNFRFKRMGYCNWRLGKINYVPNVCCRAPTMFKTSYILPFLIGIVLMLGGCGTYVPEIQEQIIPGDQAAGQLFVQAIVRSIHCEIKDAVTSVIGYEDEDAKKFHRPSQADWLLDWGAQMQITLTVDEQSSFSPSGLYSPMNIFSFLGGASASSEATRTETLSYFYPVKDLYYSHACLNPTDIADSHSNNHPTGSLLIQSDLKLTEWLLGVVTGELTGDISLANPTPANNPIAKNAITHEVTFKVITSGNITPMWKLVHATITPSPPLFMASRTRTHDLLITFGPNNQGQLATPAANTFLAAQIGLAVRNQTINSNLP